MFQLDFQYSFINKARKTFRKTFQTLQRLFLDPLLSFRVCHIDVDIRPPRKFSPTSALSDTKKAMFDEGLRAKVGTKRGWPLMTLMLRICWGSRPMVFLCFLNSLTFLKESYSSYIVWSFFWKPIIIILQQGNKNVVQLSGNCSTQLK